MRTDKIRIYISDKHNCDLTTVNDIMQNIVAKILLNMCGHWSIDVCV